MTTIFDQLPNEPLTAEEERIFSAQIKKRKGVAKAIEQLTTRSLREAVLYLRELSKHQIEDDGELVSMAYKALERSARGFDSQHGHRFFYFAKKALRGTLVEYWRGLETVKKGHSVSWDVAAADDRDKGRGGTDLGVDSEPTSEIEGRVEPDFSAIDRREEWAEIEKAMVVLTKFERAVVLFVKATGYSFQEVGEEFGYSRAWIGYTWNKAVAKLRAKLVK